MSSEIDFAAAFGSAIDQIETDTVHRRHRNDPAAWAKDVLGVHLWSAQREIARSVVENRLVAVQSAAGVGKSYLASILALWFGSVYPQWITKVVTTAPSSNQVSAILWGEIKRHHAQSGLPGRVLGTDEWVSDDGKWVTGFGRKPPDYATSVFQGHHAQNMLIIADEAGGLDEKMFEDLFAIATGKNVHILAIGNPDDNSSYFAKMCQPGSNWATHKISVYDSPKFTGEDVPEDVLDAMPDPASVDAMRLEFGEDNAYFKAKVLGEFADSGDGLIPLSWVEAAVRRWHDATDETKPTPAPVGRTIFGVDVARFGKDATAIATRKGTVCYSIDTHQGKDNVEVATLVEGMLASEPFSTAVVDVDGLGSGVVDILRHRARPVIAYSGGEGTRRRTRDGKQRFARVRTAAWYHLRELLNPALGASIALPDDQLLIRELVAIRWPQNPTSNILQIERKDQVRKRLQRSTDRADAVVMAFWFDAPPEREFAAANAGAHQSVAAHVDAPGFDPPIPGWGGAPFEWN
jgi:hypothetical protein